MRRTQQSASGAWTAVRNASLFAGGTLAVHLLIGPGGRREAVERSLVVATERFYTR